MKLEMHQCKIEEEKNDKLQLIVINIFTEFGKYFKQFGRKNRLMFNNRVSLLLFATLDACIMVVEWSNRQSGHILAILSSACCFATNPEFLDDDRAMLDLQQYQLSNSLTRSDMWSHQ